MAAGASGGHDSRPGLFAPDEIADVKSLPIWLTVNGETKQESNTSFLIFDIPKLIEFASKFYTIYPGDLYYTGTPEGVSPILPGDHVVATVEGIGTLEMDVRA